MKRIEWDRGDWLIHTKDGSTILTRSFSVVFARHEGYRCKLYFDVSKDGRPLVTFPQGSRAKQESEYALSVLCGEERDLQTFLGKLSSYYEENRTLLEV